MKLTDQFINLLRRRQTRGAEDISYEQAKNILMRNPRAVLIDVRSRQEYQEGNLPGSINIPTFEIEKAIYHNQMPDKNQTIIAYCQSGGRSKKTVQILKRNGYQDVYHIQGGMNSL